MKYPESYYIACKDVRQRNMKRLAKSYNYDKQAVWLHLKANKGYYGEANVKRFIQELKEVFDERD